MKMKKNFLALSLLSMMSISASALSLPTIRTARLDCGVANQEIAQLMINNAAERISASASNVRLDWVNATGDRYVYSGSIYRADYEVIVKTDRSCSPLEVELVDLARK
jgi:hypothetical protein